MFFNWHLQKGFSTRHLLSLQMFLISHRMWEKDLFRVTVFLLLTLNIDRVWVIYLDNLLILLKNFFRIRISMPLIILEALRIIEILRNGIFRLFWGRMIGFRFWGFGALFLLSDLFSLFRLLSGFWRFCRLRNLLFLFIFSFGRVSMSCFWRCSFSWLLWLLLLRFLTHLFSLARLWRLTFIPFFWGQMAVWVNLWSRFLPFYGFSFRLLFNRFLALFGIRFDRFTLFRPPLLLFWLLGSFSGCLRGRACFSMLSRRRRLWR